MVIKDMTLTLGIFIFHLHRYNFANFRNRAHGQYFGDIQLGAVGLILNNRGVLAGQLGRGLVGQGGGGAQAAEGHNYESFHFFTYLLQGERGHGAFVRPRV